MPDSMPIEFQTKNLNDAVDALKSIGREAVNAGRDVSDMGKGMRAGGSGPRFTSGPRQRAIGLQSELRSAMKDGNRAAEGDIRDALKRTQKSIERAERGGKSSFSERLSTFARSSRFGAEGLQPLVGAGLDLLGAGGAGPIGLVTGALLEAAKAGKAFADAASQDASAFARLSQATGGTPAETGMITKIAQGLRVDPSGLTGAAEGLSSAIDPRGGDPFAISSAQRMGLDVRPPQLGGSPDLSRNFTKALDSLHYDKDANDALMNARNLHMTPFLGVRNLSDKDYESLKASGILAGRAANTLAGPGAAYDAGNARLGAALDQATAPAKRVILNAGAGASNALANILQNRNPDDSGQPGYRPAPVSEETEDRYRLFHHLGTPVFASAGPRAKAALAASLARHASGSTSGYTMTTAAGGGSGFSQADWLKAIKDHTQTMALHARAIGSRGGRGAPVGAYGAFGNVTRQGAIPDGFHYDYLRKAVLTDLAAIRLSTF